MFSSLTLAVMICFAVGTAIVVALVVRAGAGRTSGTIARVLYDAEHPEKVR
jgi:hypothetical protein